MWSLDSEVRHRVSRLTWPVVRPTPLPRKGRFLAPYPPCPLAQQRKQCLIVMLESRFRHRNGPVDLTPSGAASRFYWRWRLPFPRLGRATLSGGSRFRELGPRSKETLVAPYIRTRRESTSDADRRVPLHYSVNSLHHSSHSSLLGNLEMFLSFQMTKGESSDELVLGDPSPHDETRKVKRRNRVLQSCIPCHELRRKVNSFLLLPHLLAFEGTSFVGGLSTPGARCASHCLPLLSRHRS